jgi:hypothetical protein
MPDSGFFDRTIAESRAHAFTESSAESSAIVNTPGLLDQHTQFVSRSNKHNPGYLTVKQKAVGALSRTGRRATITSLHLECAWRPRKTDAPNRMAA